MRFNTHFKMQDFFMNDKLSKIFPQVENKFMLSNMQNEDYIRTKTQSYLCEALGGTLKGDNIEVINKSKSEIIATVNLLKCIIEGFFDNATSIISNLKSNTKLYTMVASIGQLQELKSEKDKLKFFNEIQENISYNPDFKSLNSVKSYSQLPFQKRQQMWQKKVNYK